MYFGLFCLWFAQIAFAFAGPVAMLLPEGSVQWQMLIIELDRFNPDSFPLRNRGFHWVQECPYFR